MSNERDPGKGAAPPAIANGRCLPLALLAPGRLAHIVTAQGGRGLTQRLAAMGIGPGVRVTLKRGGPRGPVIVEVKGTQIALGHGMARRVLVTPAD